MSKRTGFTSERNNDGRKGRFEIACLVCLAAEIFLLSAIWFFILPVLDSQAARRSTFSVFVGKDRRLKTISPSYSLPPGDTYLSEGPLSVTLISPKNYMLRHLDNGDQYYLDRTCTLTSVPGALRNKVGIVGYDADMVNSSSSFLQFSIDDTARISVLIDSIASRPSWLPASYTLTARIVLTSHPVARELYEYRDPSVPRGTIRFGGMNSASTGARCNYVVIVRRPLPGDAGSPAQIASAQMQLPRIGHRVVTLNNGQVLIVGGADSSNTPISLTELYDSASQMFVGTGSLNTARIDPAVVKLANGKVLAIGGGDAAPTPLASCEIYDPATGLWTATGDLNWARRLPEAIRLNDGRVFVSGGVDTDSRGDARTSTYGDGIPTTEIFNPATGLWTAGPNMLSLGPYNTSSIGVPGQRWGHRMALLSDGRVLIVGGFWRGPDLQAYAMTGCDIYDPATNMMTAGPSMNTPRAQFGLVDIGGGKIMAMGGLWYQQVDPLNPLNPTYYASTADVEVYDAATNAWTTVAPLPYGMYDFAVVSPDPGRALIFDGFNISSGTDAGDVILYDGIFNTWTQVGTLVTSRSFPLSNGAALVTDVGGKDYFLCGGTHLDVTTGQTTLMYSGERFKY